MVCVYVGCAIMRIWIWLSCISVYTSVSSAAARGYYTQYHVLSALLYSLSLSADCNRRLQLQAKSNAKQKECCAKLHMELDLICGLCGNANLSRCSCIMKTPWWLWLFVTIISNVSFNMLGISMKKSQFISEAVDLLNHMRHQELARYTEIEGKSLWNVYDSTFQCSYHFVELNSLSSCAKARTHLHTHAHAHIQYAIWYSWLF